jgi:hypothetical protein
VSLTQPSYIVGRCAAASDLVLDHSTIAKEHAFLFCKKGCMQLVTLASDSVTLVNGEEMDAEQGMFFSFFLFICFVCFNFFFLVLL